MAAPETETVSKVEIGKRAKTMGDEVRLEAHGGELHLMVYGQFVCDLAAFSKAGEPIGPLADVAVKNLRDILRKALP